MDHPDRLPPKRCVFVVILWLFVWLTSVPARAQGRDLDSSKPGWWVLVELRDGRKGFMKADTVRSPIMTRARFRKIDGRWKLVEFNRDYH